MDRPSKVLIGYSNQFARHNCTHKAEGPSVVIADKGMETFLATEGIAEHIECFVGSPVTTAEIAKIHTQAYINVVEATRGSKSSDGKCQPMWLIQDKVENDDGTDRAIDGIACHLCGHSADVALTIVGTYIQLVDKVMSGEHKKAWIMPTLGSHHAGPAYGMGYCVYNTISLAALHAVQKYSVQRVLILDWDVHHGNGTQDCLIDNDKILKVSIHRYDGGYFYPASGHPEDRGDNFMNMNIAFGLEQQGGSGRGRGDSDYLLTMQRVIIPLVEEYKPELIFIYSGFDAAKDDPVGKMEVTPKGFATMMGIMKNLAEKHCSGRLLVETGGGYSDGSFFDSLKATLDEFLLPTSEMPKFEISSPKIETFSDLLHVMTVHGMKWDCLGSKENYQSLAKEHMILKNKLEEQTKKIEAQKPPAPVETEEGILADITTFMNTENKTVGDPEFRNFVVSVYPRLLALKTGEKVIDCPLAIKSIEILYQGQELAKLFIQFLKEGSVKGITRDVFYMLPTFFDVLKGDLKNYSDEDAWPVVLDDFVEYGRSPGG